MTEIYDFIEWGGIVVPDNPREIVVSPESIEQMLGNSLDNFTMVERVTSGEDSHSIVYMFDKNVYSYETEGGEAVVDSMENAGAWLACYSVGFFYSLNEERFILNEEISREDVLVYDYECGITADGIDYDSISVKLYYEGDTVCEILLSYVVDVLGATYYEYSFTDFGATEVQIPEKALVKEMLGESINRVAVEVNKIIRGTSTYTEYKFDYSDYVYGIHEIEYEYARLKDSAAVFITDWLGTLVELDASDFDTVSTSNELKEYKTTVPVVSQGVTYRETEISISYCGNAKDGYELGSILIIFKKGENGEQIQYYFSEFGKALVDTRPEEEEPKEIPAGYMENIAKDASLLNYTLLVGEKYFINGEFVDIGSTMVYEFDSHRARCYPDNYPESAEYISEDYVGMAFATELLSVITKLDDSKYVNMSGKGYGNITKGYYEYNGTATVDGITLKNICVYLTYRDNELIELSISYSMDVEIESDVATVDVFYTFYAFGDTVVVFPDDDTVVKFGFQRFESQNYKYNTYIAKNDTRELYASGKYDADKFFEKVYGDEYGNYYYTENAGLRDFNRFFKPLLSAFSEGELVYSVKENYEGFEYVQIYTGSTMKIIDVQIGKESYRASASNFIFEFCYYGGELEKINISYDAVIDGEVCQISSFIYGIGEQCIIMPSERDFWFDPDNADEFCGISLDNFSLHESVTNNGSAVSSFSGDFEKDFAKYSVLNGTTVAERFNGAADRKGKELVDEKLGFIYDLDPEYFEIAGAYDSTVIFEYQKTVTLNGDKLKELKIKLTYDELAVEELIFIEVSYTRVTGGVKYFHKVILSKFGQIALERTQEKKTIPQDLYNVILSPELQTHAYLTVRKNDEIGLVSETSASYYGYNSTMGYYEIAFENHNDFSQYKAYNYTTLDAMKAGYEENFAFFLNAFKLIDSSKLVCEENNGIYKFSGKIDYEGYKIRVVSVEITDEFQLSINIFGRGDNGEFTMSITIGL